MTIDDVEASLNRIRDRIQRMDDEAAHGEEDELYEAIVRAAARGEDVREIAKLAITTKGLCFSRWCA